MQASNTRTMYILIGVAVLAVLAGIVTLSIWGSSTGKAEPTVSVDAIYTAAAQTFTAQRATQLALNPSTSTPSPTLPPTLPPPTQPFLFPTLAFSTPTTGVVKGCDDSAFVSDITVPDGTVMTPEQRFTKTWLMQNTGTCTWDTSYSLAFVSGEQMGGVKTPLTLSVPPGQQIKISVDFKAPAEDGKYKSIWQLMNGNGVLFGNTPWVVIKVAAEPTAAPTDTPSGP